MSSRSEFEEVCNSWALEFLHELRDISASIRRGAAGRSGRRAVGFAMSQHVRGSRTDLRCEKSASRFYWHWEAPWRGRSIRSYSALRGAPGGLLTHAATKRTGTGTIPTWGLLLTLAGQLYASLTWVAFVTQSVNSLSAGSAGVGKWVLWIVGFWVACVPASIALKDAARAEPKTVQHGATTLTAPLTYVGFFLFVFVPSVLRAGWGWVPHF